MDAGALQNDSLYIKFHVEGMIELKSQHLIIINVDDKAVK